MTEPKPYYKIYDHIAVYIGRRDGQARREAWEAAARQAGFETLGKWLTRLADEASGYKPE